MRPPSRLRPGLLLLLSAVLPLLGLHCGLFGDDAPVIDVQGQAFYLSTCAPTDGPAFTVFVTPEVTTCADLDRLVRTYPPESRVLRLFLYGSLEPPVPATFALDANDFVMGGVVDRCEAGGPCVSTETGTVSFDETSAEGVLMTYELRFSDDGVERGRYVVRACPAEVPPFCG